MNNPIFLSVQVVLLVQMRVGTLSPQLQIDSEAMLVHITTTFKCSHPHQMDSMGTRTRRALQRPTQRKVLLVVIGVTLDASGAKDLTGTNFADAASSTRS